MIEIEKKFSDYQQNECDKEELQEKVIDPKVCPTCIPNPSFKLDKDWWDIPEGYLNEADCEYHIRVYQVDAEKELSSRIRQDDASGAEPDVKYDVAFEIGIMKLLSDLKKPIDEGVVTQLKNATYTLDGSEDTRNTGDPLRGQAWRIRIPAFNFDQIESTDSENSEEKVGPSASSKDQLIIKAENFNKKIKQIKDALKTFSSLYSLAQQSSSSFLIFRKDNPILRINYEITARYLLKFKELLNEALLRKGYPRIQDAGLFKPKRPKSFKIIFEEDSNYKLKSILALPDDGCGKYEDLEIPISSPLRNENYGVVYNFLANMDEIINDLTAREDVSWLDWTLNYFYPEYDVNRGSIINPEETKAGLECLLENQLGLDSGKIVDSLTSQVMSAFSLLEDKLQDQACKSLEEEILGPSDVIKQEREEELKRKEKLLKEKYKKKYENKVKKEIKKYMNSIRLEGSEKIESNEEAVQKYLSLSSVPGDKEHAILIEIDYVVKEDDENRRKEKFQKAYTPYWFDLNFSSDSIAFAQAAYLGQKQIDFSLENDILVSDDYQLGLKAIKETLTLDDNSFMSVIKESFEGSSDFEITDLIPTIGLCGMSKVSGKALSCLLKGVPFDKFLAVLIDKTFEFMEVNTFGLFFNSLPPQVAEEINKAISREFGPNMNIEALFNIKNSGEPSQKLKDFLKSKQKGKEVLRILKKSPDLEKLSEQDTEKLKSIFKMDDLEEVFEGLKGYMETAGYEKASGLFKPPGLDPQTKKISLPKPTKPKENKDYDPEAWVLKSIKNLIKDTTAKDVNFKLATESLFKTVGTWSYNTAEDVMGFIANEQAKAERDINKRNEEFLDSFGDPGFQFSDISSAPVAAANYVAGSAVDLADRIFPEQVLEEKDIDIYTKTLNSSNETSLGVKVDIIFDIVFSYLVDYILDYFSLDELYDSLKRYPAVDFALDLLESTLLQSCPTLPIINPPPDDILKGLTVEVCDPTKKMAMPTVFIPSLSYRFHMELKFSEKFREVLTNMFIKIALGILNRVMNTIEGALCKSLEAVGGFVADGIKDGTLGQDVSDVSNRFIDALNEAFCNDSQNEQTLNERAEELADALFSPLIFNSNQPNSGSSKKITNIVSSVATKDELLEAMVAREGEENQQFTKRIANAINALAPEAAGYLGDPTAVSYFFSNLGSYLTEDDKERIRDLLAAGIPNLPVSDAICLTNEQLDEWDKLRENLLSDYPNPEDIVRSLNDQTLAALSDIMDDVGDLDTDGPFIAPLINELNKDVCNPNNILNDLSADELSKSEQDAQSEAFFDNLTRSLIKGFSGRNSVLGEAMADIEGRKEFSRKFRKIFNPNYKNSQSERDLKYNNISGLGKFVMNALTEDGKAIGEYPRTVGLDQRSKVLNGGLSLDFDSEKSGVKSSKNVVLRYKDTQDEFTYETSVASSNILAAKNTFRYNLQVIEKIDSEPGFTEVNINIPVNTSRAEHEYLKSISFDFRSNSEKDIRKEAFKALMNSQLPLDKNYGDLYEECCEIASDNMLEGIFSNYDEPENLPIGYQFGYVNETITKDSFKYYNPDGTTEYNLEEESKTLGVFGSPRIIPLDPALYGGRYSNPSYYVEPRQFKGWMEVATKAFVSNEGCEPKNPPLISFGDISNRTKMLSNSMPNDPRLSKDPDCVSIRPFKLLLDSKNKSKIDGVVRSTIRSYIAESFIKGYGLFSNMEYGDDNFDSSLPIYLVEKMKSEMSQLGTTFFNDKISIKQDRYWYTFLEQCVEAYQRQIDIDGLTPPVEIMKDLTSIETGAKRFIPIDKDIKKKMRERISENLHVIKPDNNFSPLDVMSEKPEIIGLQAVAFRLTTDEEEKRNFFNGELYDKTKANNIRFASLKKLRFFQKIYFIRLYERESIRIMTKLVEQEIKRFSELLIQGLSDKPYYRDIFKAMLGMKSFFPESTSVVGLNKFYSEKQIGNNNPGDVPDVSFGAPLGDKPRFVVQKYARISDNENEDAPSIIQNRPTELRGVVSLEDLYDFFLENSESFEELSISQLFGNLSFTYKGSFKALMRKGYANEESILRLFKLNSSVDAFLPTLRSKMNDYILGNDFEDIDVIYDDYFLSPSEQSPKPFGVTGETGIKYGLRICLVLPPNSGYVSEEEIEILRNDISFFNKSRKEKAFLMENNSLMIPVCQAEVEMVDCDVINFNPFSGDKKYDLECLINKITKDPSFTTFFHKMLNLKQLTSMSMIYCIESFMPCLGRGDGERTEDYLDSLDYEDSWDGTINKFAKNFLRRQFQSLYLANTFDGQSPDDDNEDRDRLLNLSNPFGEFLSFDVNIPWWLRRKMKTKVFDANGQECADPAKDLT